MSVFFAYVSRPPLKTNSNAEPRESVAKVTSKARTLARCTTNSNLKGSYHARVANILHST